MPSDTPSRPMLSIVPKDASSAFYRDRATERGGPVLVLGSAAGHIACELAHAGFQVTGVEPSEVLMLQAHEAKQSRPPDVAMRVSLIQSDLRAVRVGTRFPVVLAPQNAFGALGSPEDLEGLLATVKAHLAPEGTFVFDIALPASTSPGQHLESNQGRPAQRPPIPRAVFVPHLRERKRTTQKVDQVGLHRLRLRQFSPGELDEALSVAGLTAMEKYGDFRGKPFDPGDPLLVVVASPV